MKERRENIRLGSTLEITYKVTDRFFRSGTHSIDISKGGLRLVCLQRLTVGITLHLEIRMLEMRRPIRAIGEVMWVKTLTGGQFPFEMGIKFIKITPHDEQILAALCKRLAGDEGASEKIRWLV